MSKYISIIGHRDSPPEILEKIAQIAEFFAKKGWILRSGGADGVDSAAESGYDKVGGLKEIYLPWKGFNENKSQLEWTKANWDEAAKFHPRWSELKGAVKQLHARNMAIILGLDNNTPSDLVVAYTLNGEMVGGTSTGLRCAAAHDIKVFNLGSKTGLTRLRKYCKNIKQ
jgi:predicted Rossmann fold nucleotide-binding protein DprA/Smf involved in DNA uptake